ncbi:MAG: hypothetical protein ACI8TP_000822 [Acidimicrobiales bacterium]
MGKWNASSVKAGIQRRRFLASWVLRRAFWNRLATLKFGGQKATVIPEPSSDGRWVKLMPLGQKYPELTVGGVVVADHVPRDEAEPLKQKVTRLQAVGVRRVSPMQPGLPSVPPDADKALSWAFTGRHAGLYPRPQRPADLGLGVGSDGLARQVNNREGTLGALAVASPYAAYLRAAGPGRFEWNLAELGAYECHDGLVKLGAKVDFVLDPQTGWLRAGHIETALGSVRPGDSGWASGTRLAVCSITTHASLVRHFNWLHLTSGAPLEAITRNRLPHRHPVRRLLWPHVFGTHANNDLVTQLQMAKGGEFESIFSFTHDALLQLFEDTTDQFQLAAINPALDAEQRGVDLPELVAPAQENRCSLLDVFERHAQRYLALYFNSDEEVAGDPDIAGWLADLDAQLPGGVSKITGKPPTLRGLASLAATLIYLATVEHEITGSGLWDYQLWNDTSPVRVYEDGRNVPLDVYQRLINADFNLNVSRTPLLADFSYLALDARGEQAFKQFTRDLERLQRFMDLGDAAPWRMEPKRLKANINA